MDKLSSRLAMQRVFILIWILLFGYMVYRALITTAVLDFFRFSQMGLPLGMMCNTLADYPRFKETSARKPLRVLGWVFLLGALFGAIAA